MTVKELNAAHYPAYFERYFELLDTATDLNTYLEIATHQLIQFYQEIPLDKMDFRYAPDKWTAKEILQHIIDTDRIFAYRALRVARRDATPLPGFDENAFNNAALVLQKKRSLQDLLSEFASVRQSILALFKSFNNEDLTAVGNASGNTISAAAIGFVIVAHGMHHCTIFSERYL